MGRHTNINDIIKRSLAAAGSPAQLEPVGCDRTNSKRPDGTTYFPFSNGKCLAWDATVVDTFAKTYINETASNPGFAADKAEEKKVDHYGGLEDRFRFTPIAFETTGVYGKTTEKFIKELGRRIRGSTGDARHIQWLRQRLSLAIDCMRQRSICSLHWQL